MLIVKGIGVGVSDYFLDGRHNGRWSPGAGRLLSLEGPVRRGDLVAVLRGEHPVDRRYLPAYRAARRRAGWDLIFCAPKSLSLMEASPMDAAGGEPSGPVAQAHCAAVEAVVGHIESSLTVRRLDSAGGFGPAGGLIGASFTHHTNAAGEPHLHTHVLVANLTCSAGRWSAVRAEDWYTGRQALGALYQLGLRHQLALHGLSLDWRLQSDGLADLALVPRAAVRATSSQAHVARALGRFEARRRAVPQEWRERAVAAGFDPTAAVQGRPAAGPSLFDPAVTRTVTTRLAVRRSDFRRADVVVALAACWPSGAPPDHVLEWVDRFCARNEEVPSPTAGRRWTTDLARRADQALVRDLEAHGKLTVMRAPPGESLLLAQTEGIDARAARSGLRFAVSSPSPSGELRWAVLAGIPPFRPGDQVDVLVVDQADRRPTAELARLVGAARRSGAELVFVEGGTMPALTNPASRGWAGAVREMERDACDQHRPWGLPAGTAGAGPGGPESLTGRVGAEEVLARWYDAQRSGQPVLLSALGLEEVRGLNRAARLILGRTTPGGFEPGDRVVLLRARHDGVRHGEFGTVADGAGPASPDGGSVWIRWDGRRRPERHGPDIVPRLGYGYAASVRLAAETTAQVALLGPERAASGLRGRLLVTAEERTRERGMTRALGL
ncbi:MAG: relaxase domain-containing protein [Acidimicrobiales bacterium]|nr:relaxase domain-containing protein [Acidimicrobiales bacterium]